MSDAEHGRDDLIDALEALPEVEYAKPDMDVALQIAVTGEFVLPRVVGTIAAHSWGLMSVGHGFPVIVGAWPGPPDEVVR